jgi:ribosomal protein S18 acetylase RimI-like enzyme
MTVRVCAPGDETILSLLGQATFLESFAGMLDGNDILRHCMHEHSPAVYRSWLENEDFCIWVAEVEPGGAPVGYVVLAPSDLPVADPRSDDREIKRIYLLRPFQGAGVGKRLMEAALSEARAQDCRRVLLGVYSLNTKAIAFYERLGFVKIGTRRFRVGNAYHDDAVMAIDT